MSCLFNPYNNWCLEMTFYCFTGVYVRDCVLALSGYRPTSGDSKKLLLLANEHFLHLNHGGVWSGSFYFCISDLFSEALSNDVVLSKRASFQKMLIPNVWFWRAVTDIVFCCLIWRACWYIFTPFTPITHPRCFSTQPPSILSVAVLKLCGFGCGDSCPSNKPCCWERRLQDEI